MVTLEMIHVNVCGCIIQWNSRHGLPSRSQELIVVNFFRQNIVVITFKNSLADVAQALGEMPIWFKVLQFKSSQV